jgi:hypothetical protein
MASLKMSSTSQLINFDKLVQYLTKYNSRIATLRTLLEAFDKETKDIVEVLKLSTFHTIALEQLCMLMFAKLEILRKEANFIVFGVKSFKYHKSDDPPLFVPNALPMNILTDVMAYSAISSEYLSIQMIEFELRWQISGFRQKEFIMKLMYFHLSVLFLFVFFEISTFFVISVINSVMSNASFSSNIFPLSFRV